MRRVYPGSPQSGQVHAPHSGGHHHPKVPEDVCGEETLQAETGCCSGHADDPQGLHGPTEVPGGKTHSTECCIFKSSTSPAFFDPLTFTFAMGPIWNTHT